MIRQREVTKREQLAIERQLFEQRTSLRQVKQNLPDEYKEGDEDILINQKKKKPLEINQRPPNVLRLPSRGDGKSIEADLLSLSDTFAAQAKDIQDQIDLKIAQHKQWNQDYVDLTKAPLTPPLDIGVGSTFRTATTEYLPTPPASVSSEQSGDANVDVAAVNLSKGEPVAVRYASPSYDGPTHSQPSFRRRYGRGGRLWIDRRGMRLQNNDGPDALMADRFKYDDDDDEEEVPTHFIDPFDCESTEFRSRLFAPSVNQAQIHAAQAARRGRIPSSISAAGGLRRPSGN